MEKMRCDWCLVPKKEEDRRLYIDYHDDEWGIPQFEDHILFEMLILEGAQAGLSWLTILKKRQAYREAFEQFEVNRVATMTTHNIEQLMKNPNIVRNRLKIQSTIGNAQVWQQIAQTHGSFSEWLWSHVQHKPVINRPKTLLDIPTRSLLSDQISESLKKMGMKFVGSTIIYAFLQATGVVNDHLVSCHCCSR